MHKPKRYKGKSTFQSFYTNYSLVYLTLQVKADALFCWWYFAVYKNQENEQNWPC